MKIVVLFFFLILNLFASIITLDKPIKQKQYIGAESLVFIDKEHRYTLDNIQDIKDRFTPVQKINFGYTKDSVWSYFKLENKTKNEQLLLFRNPYSNMLYVDVLIVKNGKTQKHLLGCLREKNIKEIPNRASVFKLFLDVDQNADIYIRHSSNNTFNIDWEIMPPQIFTQDSFWHNFAFGIFAGVVFTLIIYTLSVYRTFREISLIFYILFAFGNMILHFSLNGVLYMLDFGFSPLTAISLSGEFNFFPIMMLSFFTLTFFHLKDSPIYIKGVLYLIIAISLAVMLLHLPIFYEKDAWIAPVLSNALFVLSYLTFFAIGIYLVKQKLAGAKYYLMSIGTFIIVFSIGIMFVMGFINIKVEPLYYGLIAVATDLIFLSLAISQKILLLQKDKQKIEKIMLEHTRFKNIGVMISEVIHQIKSPITQISAIANRIAMIFDQKSDVFSKQEQDLAQQLENNLIFMSQTVNKLYDSYRSEPKNVDVNIDDLIMQTLDIFSNKIKDQNIKIEYEQKDIQIVSEPSAIKHILLVILENGIDIVKERNVKNPTITINTKEDDKNLIIEIKDNAGGVDNKKIDHIFDMYESYKKSKGLGLGLALAKTLMQDVLKGYIKVSNIKDGAMFTLLISK